MIDFDVLVLGPVYDAFGEPAVLTVRSVNYDLTVIDHTEGVTVDEGGRSGYRPFARRLTCVAARSSASALPLAISSMPRSHSTVRSGAPRASSTTAMSSASS